MAAHGGVCDAGHAAVRIPHGHGSKHGGVAKANAWLHLRGKQKKAYDTARETAAENKQKNKEGARHSLAKAQWPFHHQGLRLRREYRVAIPAGSMPGRARDAGQSNRMRLVLLRCSGAHRVCGMCTEKREQPLPWQECWRSPVHTPPLVSCFRVNAQRKSRNRGRGKVRCKGKEKEMQGTVRTGTVRTAVRTGVQGLPGYYHTKRTKIVVYGLTIAFLA